eukprot:366344-Chlamydomonas_euryale.AAC.15
MNDRSSADIFQPHTLRAVAKAEGADAAAARCKVLSVLAASTWPKGEGKDKKQDATERPRSLGLGPPRRAASAVNDIPFAMPERVEKMRARGQRGRCAVPAVGSGGVRGWRLALRSRARMGQPLEAVSSAG